MITLSNIPARDDLTDRECARILGGTIGSLVGMVQDKEVVRRAVRWWVQNDEAWDVMPDVVEASKEIAAQFVPRRG